MDRPDRFRPPALGVGLVYWRELAPLFEAGIDLAHVLELEPQTLWEQTGSGDGRRYRVDQSAIEQVASLPQHKLVHGVGQPLGGTAPDPVPYADPLRHCIDVLDPPWVSEHLSFSRYVADRQVRDAGFLLPPPQTRAAVRVAGANIARHRRITGRPVAFETGVNYLQPDDAELSDGEFFSRVSDAGGCGILVDLHNLWCNEQNGRGRVSDVLAAVPLERVWEIHLAGGTPADGYRLDAHRGLIPPEVLDHASALVPQLPHLGAIVFEIMPDSAVEIGLDAVGDQLADLHHLWSQRPVTVAVDRRRGPAVAAVSSEDMAEVACWESELAGAIRNPGSASGRLSEDGGVRLFRELIGDARRGALAVRLRCTITALLAGAGRSATYELIDSYLDSYPPAPYAAVESDAFATFLRARLRRLQVPYLAEVVSFEQALIRADICEETSTVEWSSDPTAVLEALRAGRLPDGLPAVRTSTRIGPVGAAT